MKPYKDLFEQYSNGMLPDEQVEELNQQLIHLYFESPGDLNEEEMIYTEDLVFDLYASNNLDETYSIKLKEKFDSDKSLFRKHNLLQNINEASQTEKEKRFQQTFDTESEKQEEEELKEVLGEVIEKVHAEKEKSTADSGFENIFAKLQALFKELIPPINFAQPRLQLAMVAVSVVLLFVVVWWSVNPTKKDLLADNIRQEKISGFIASNFEPSPDVNFNDIVSRNLTDTITQPTEFDTLKIAVERYNNQDYSGCKYLLEYLTERNSFQHPQTISMINFYLGNCYLVNGLNHENEEQLNLSINSFQLISEGTRYYLPSLWYLSFAQAKVGNEKEALRLLNYLLQENSYKPGEVQTFRDSLEIYMSTK